MNRFIALLLAALTVGCAAPGVRLSEEQIQAVWQQRQAQLAALEIWDIRGRIALQAEDRGWQASLHWVRSKGRQQVRLTGPLGRGYVTLRQDNRGAYLQDSAGKDYYAEDPEALLSAVIGWELPLNGLIYWVRGLSAPGSPAETVLDRQGRLQSLRQRQWRIRFLRYGDYAGLQLPQKLFLTRDRSEDGDRTLEVRLVINGWKPGG